MNKRLFELRKELRQVKKMVDKHNKYCQRKNIEPKSWFDYDWGMYSGYYFITKDGKSYVFDTEDYEFPNINISTVVYISCSIPCTIWQKNGKWYKNNKYDMYDSEIGYYNEMDDTSYTKKICNKFKIKKG